MEISEARKLIIEDSLDSQIAYFLGVELKRDPEQRKELYEARNTFDMYNAIKGNSKNETDASIDSNLYYMTEHGE